MNDSSQRVLVIIPPLSQIPLIVVQTLAWEELEPELELLMELE